MWQVSNKSHIPAINFQSSQPAATYNYEASQRALDCFLSKCIIKGIIKEKSHKYGFSTTVVWFFNTPYFKNHPTEIKKSKNVWLWDQYVNKISSQHEMVGCKFYFPVCWFAM
jgi:hypothetical protein